MTITTAHRPAAGRRTLGALRVLAAAAVRYAAGPAVPAPAAKRSVVAPARVAEQLETAAVFTDEEMPPLADIAAAAEQYMRAAEQARTADRAKRAARKLLDRLPAGRYGAWNVERVDNAREVADLDTIRAIFTAHGLGDVPMKPCAPSLKVAVATELAPVAALIAA